MTKLGWEQGCDGSEISPLNPESYGISWVFIIIVTICPNFIRTEEDSVSLLIEPFDLVSRIIDVIEVQLFRSILSDNVRQDIIRKWNILTVLQPADSVAVLIRKKSNFIREPNCITALSSFLISQRDSG